ncbi:MAG: plasmid mobilization relaxosome protein MobC [Alphaproteobacteria bacterium]|nr:plasmid mobilization relaxosome protein MobC [Alphaproteobacteria bacterium]
MSRSESRQRPHTMSVRLSPEEREALLWRAGDVGLSISDYTRAILLERHPIGVGNVRQRVPTSAERALARFAAEVGNLAFEINKIGVNVNQLAHAANAGAAVPRDAVAVAADALAHLATPLATIRDAVLASLAPDRATPEGEP